MILQPYANSTHFGSCGLYAVGSILSITKSELYIKTKREQSLCNNFVNLALSFMFAFSKNSSP